MKDMAASLRRLATLQPNDVLVADGDAHHSCS
jgi:hypothetical protein